MFSLMFQSVNLFETYKKPMDWFLFDRDLRHKRVHIGNIGNIQRKYTKKEVLKKIKKTEKRTWSIS